MGLLFVLPPPRGLLMFNCTEVTVRLTVPHVTVCLTYCIYSPAATGIYYYSRQYVNSTPTPSACCTVFHSSITRYDGHSPRQRAASSEHPAASRRPDEVYAAWLPGKMPHRCGIQCVRVPPVPGSTPPDGRRLVGVWSLACSVHSLAFTMALSFADGNAAFMAALLAWNTRGFRTGVIPYLSVRQL